jgi:hypothetical protein
MLRRCISLPIYQSNVELSTSTVQQSTKSVATSGITHRTQQHHIPRGLNLQQHRCEKLKSHIIAVRPCTQTFASSSCWSGLSGCTCIESRRTWDKSAGAWSWPLTFMLVLIVRINWAHVYLSSQAYTAWCRNKHRENLYFIVLPFALYHSDIILFSVWPLSFNSEIKYQNRTAPEM